MNVVQLGGEDLRKVYEIPAEMDWFYEPDLTLVGNPPKENDETEAKAASARDRKLTKIRQFDAAILLRQPTSEEAVLLNRKVQACGLFVSNAVSMNEKVERLLKCRRGTVINEKKIQELIREKLPAYYQGSYGEKCRQQEFVPSCVNNKRIEYSGYRGITIEGDFGGKLQQAGFWTTNVPLFPGESLDFWLEFQKDPSVNLELHIRGFAEGSVDIIPDQWTFSENEISSGECLTIHNSGKQKENLFVSLNAKGKGKLNIIALHDRWSRDGAGVFLPGGERMTTSDREEAFFYFDPGDLKPPLNVYFSGYRSKEGFEGYNMMRRTGAPFLLISDPRLEGGCFYLGSKEYEDGICRRIQLAMKDLGFSRKDVILSGISMGTTGAMYYGAKISPGYVILGKPLASLGSLAMKERIECPGVFSTSLDMLGKLEGDLSMESVGKLDERFWDVFRSGDWSETTFFIAYMIEDDYDRKAYENVLESLNRVGTRVIGKGFHGRHNDNTAGIVEWFQKQYRNVLEKNYERTENAE